MKTHAKTKPETQPDAATGAGDTKSQLAATQRAPNDAKAAAAAMRDGMVTLGVEDWNEAASRLLVAMKVESGDGEDEGASRARLKVDAAKEVIRKWKPGLENDDVLKLLFPAARGTKKSRTEDFKAVVEFARAATRTPDRLLWNSKSSDPLAASIRHAWEPLGIGDDALLKNAVREAKEFFENPAGKLETSRLALHPLLVRWLAVMRDKRIAEQKRQAALARG